MDMIVGFLWGLLVSIVNYSYLQYVIKKNAGKSSQRATTAVVNAYFMHYFLDLVALVVVYKHMWVLLGTAIGLIVMLHYLIVKLFIEGRKHPYVSKRPKRGKPKVAPEAGISAMEESPDEAESTPGERPEPEVPGANERIYQKLLKHSKRNKGR
jgi:hypothetical protein